MLAALWGNSISACRFPVLLDQLGDDDEGGGKEGEEDGEC